MSTATRRLTIEDYGYRFAALAIEETLETPLALAGILDRALKLAREEDRALEPARKFIENLASARTLNRDLADDYDVTHALSTARALLDALDNAHALSSAISFPTVVDLAADPALELSPVLALASDLGRDLIDACADVDEVVRFLDRTIAGGAVTQNQCGPGRVASSAADLLAAATRLLPAADRGRYAEEYQSELWDLAQCGAGRLRQLGYALRQLLRALPMGRVLRSPRRRSVAP
jgi:hypothetical protein